MNPAVYKERRPGMRRRGEVVLEVVMDDDDDVMLFADGMDTCTRKVDLEMMIAIRAD